MNNALTILASLILMGCCYEQKPDPSMLIATDKAFSQMSIDKGGNMCWMRAQILPSLNNHS